MLFQTRNIDLAKISFIVGINLEKKQKGDFLGYVWIVLESFDYFLIYLFVFTVIRARSKRTAFLLAWFCMGLYKVQSWQVSIRFPSMVAYHVSEIKTSVLIKAAIWHRIIDISLQSFLIAVILIVAFEASIFWGIVFLMIGQIMGLLFSV